MNPQDVIRALQTVPEKRLQLIELARQVVKTDGTIDLEKASFLAAEISQASQEAEGYGNATQRAVWSLKRLM